MVCSRYPKECRYYDTKLKRKCFTTLKINVWENKVKWKLVKKADVHYKIKTLNKYFSLWTTFLHNFREKRNKSQIAKDHYVRKLKIKSVIVFVKNVENSLRISRFCKEKIEFNIKSRIWHQWKHYTEKRAKIREIKLLSNKIKQERVILKFIYIWFYRFKESFSLKISYEKAAVQHNQKLFQTFFTSWKIFKHKKVCKKQIEKLSVVCYEDKLKEKVFRSWVEIKSHKTLYKSQEGFIRSFYENYILNEYLMKWYVAHKKLNTKFEIYNTNLAEEFYKRKLLEKALEVLLNFKNRKKFLKRKQSKFQEMYCNVFFTHYINIWVKRNTEKLIWNNLESKVKNWRELYLTDLLLTVINNKYAEKKEEKEQMRNVVRYFNAIILHKSFEKWLVFTARRLNKKLKIENAEKFYLEKIQQKTLERWNKFVGKKRKKELANVHYHNALLTKALDTWIKLLNKRKTKLLEVLHLERNSKLKLLKEAFTLWKTQTNYIKSNLQVAVNFYNKSKMSQSFNFWKKFAQRQRNHKHKYNRNKKVIHCIIIKNALGKWYKELEIKRSSIKKLEEFSEKRSNRIIAFYFYIWIKFVKKRKNIKQTFRNFPAVKHVILLDYYLSFMADSLRFIRVLKIKEEIAKKSERKLLKKKYMRRWTAFVCWKKVQIINCLSEKHEETKMWIPIDGRRRPIIPDFLRAEFNFEHFQGDTSLINNETYRVSNPVNKKLPVIGPSEMYLSHKL